MCNMLIVTLCCYVNNQNIHWESVSVGHCLVVSHLVASHLVDHCLVVIDVPDAAGKVVEVDEYCSTLQEVEIKEQLTEIYASPPLIDEAPS